MKERIKIRIWLIRMISVCSYIAFILDFNQISMLPNADRKGVGIAIAKPSHVITGANGYPQDPKQLKLLSTNYSIVRAFVYKTWGFFIPREDFLLSGKKSRVDTQIGSWTASDINTNLPYLSIPGLGRGIEVQYEGGKDCVYRDKNGVRLILHTSAWSSGLILSTQSKYKAKLVKRDLGTLRTKSGVGIGDREKRIRSLLGKPSKQVSFEKYQLLWYLQKPKHVIVKGWGEYDEGHIAVYALQDGKVVEVYLQSWDTQAGG